VIALEEQTHLHCLGFSYFPQEKVKMTSEIYNWQLEEKKTASKQSSTICTHM
jgi:hypothetical protein